MATIKEIKAERERQKAIAQSLKEWEDRHGIYVTDEDKPETITETRRETNNIQGTSPAPAVKHIATSRETQTEIPLETCTTEAINATGREKKKRGRPATGGKAMTSAERVRLSRYRRKYPDTSTAYSGKMLSTMISGEAHSALDDLLNKYSVLSQKEIIEMAIIKLNRKGE
jgi:hypothetical protein